MNQPEQYVRQLEIKQHIKTLFEFYNEIELDPDEYMQCALIHDLQKVLLCFRSLIYQVDALKRKRMIKNEAPRPVPTRTEKLFSLQTSKS